MYTEFEEMESIINISSNVVFFGGAGVSTESNIPDFRSEEGIYKTKTNYGYSPEVILSHSFFIEHPDKFFKFYKEKMIYRDALPNTAHYTIANLEKNGRLKAVITQNIDGLHQKAGSENVIELHGSVYRNYCIKCSKRFSLEYVTSSIDIIPVCDYCKGIVRPDVVLYEEELNQDVINKAITAISRADVLIIGGTSLVVYPAASLIRYFKGSKLVLINKSPTPYDSEADIVINDSICKVFGSIMKCTSEEQ
jgi:NAD-dependent deacetylase